MQIEPIAVFHSPISGKFGVPRQAGLAEGLCGTVELMGKYRCPEALRGLEGFDYLWLIWNFNLNDSPDDGQNSFRATVRPPRLGGNERIGVFASRSPFRPNGLGLSSVRIGTIDYDRCLIKVTGADLADGTPIFDIKPYVEYADSHPGVRSGFVDSKEWKALEVFFDECPGTAVFSEEQKNALAGILSLDPRPAYQNDPEKIYGLTFAGYDIHFKVRDDSVIVLDIQGE